MQASRRICGRASGFTLIELLTVMLIIGILMGLILGVAVFAQRKNLEARAKSDIETLCTALTDYKMDVGEFPAMAGWIEELYEKGFLSGGFVEIDSGTGDAFINDPWGNEYVYTYDDTVSAQTFRLISLGADGLGEPSDPEETLADNIEAGRY